VTTPLNGPLKRALEVDGVDYTLTIDPEGLKLVAKGHRKGHALTWVALVSGDAALATALNASLAAVPASTSPAAASGSPAVPARAPVAPPVKKSAPASAKAPAATAPKRRRKPRHPA
jgi:hypothetical protein